MSDKDVRKPNDQDVELLIDKKVADAKLDVSEKRLSHALWFFGFVITIFGVIVPLLTANSNSNKTDRAIDEMKAQFRELAGTALRKPDLDCFVDGKKLNNGVLQFSPSRRERTIEVRNIGDGTAKSIQVRVYCVLRDRLSLYIQEGMGAYGRTAAGTSDEPDFGSDYIYIRASVSVNPKDSITFTLQDMGDLPTTNVPALIRVFCEQQEPRNVSFGVSVSGKD